MRISDTREVLKITWKLIDTKGGRGRGDEGKTSECNQGHVHDFHFPLALARTTLISAFHGRARITV